MSKTIWIFNHYAGNMFITGGGRHYYIAKYLKESGFNPIIFCSNFDHFTRKNCVDCNSLWIEKKNEDIDVPFAFIKTREYSGNGVKRVFNMLDFYRGMLKTAKQYAKENGTPDVIYASSVHPLTLVAGIKIAKHFRVKCISEVRDLWPESIVAYSTKWKRNNPIIRVLYAGEKWIYKKSDYLIMTWPGGFDYIKNQGWQNSIPKSKVIHISNGVDLETYINNINDYKFEDISLNEIGYKSFVYTGSVRRVNNIEMLLEAAAILREKGNNTARIIVFGEGDELERLKEEARNKNINNIVFKGRVSKQCIPSILSQSYALILHNKSTDLDKYGQSQNKFFEYLAAGRPILMTYSVGHSIIKNNNCGIELDIQTPETIAEAIDELCVLPDYMYLEYCENAKKCSQAFDYRELSQKLIEIINICMKKE